VTAAEVRKVVDGTFGGRFEQFGGGKFKFIATPTNPTTATATRG